MGGMQVLQYGCMFPDRWQRAVSIAATGRTSPSTVALRSVQRSAVMADPKYHGGNYHIGDGPTVGLGIARRIGTIAYRSRQEFDHRFNWTPDQQYRFEVESYLDRAAHSFQGRYDANCYLLLSRCMDLMNLG
jgi:homoserine O-acetyltransferase